MSKIKFSTEEWIEKAKLIHGDRYDYSETKYTGALNKIGIICKVHGYFEQTASSHLSKKNCIKCKTNTLNNNEWIKKANIKHQNKYDYSKLNYINAKEKVIIICKLHGEFSQNAGSHLFGSGCPKCGLNKFSTEEWIEKAKLIHGERYDYSKSIYLHSEEKISIICKTHGQFEQLAYHHLTGSNCSKCSKSLVKKNQTLTQNEFIEKAKLIHINKYQYHKVEYINSQSKVWIHCNKEDVNGLAHGDFYQQCNSHLNGQGCPKCALKFDKSESEVHDFISSILTDKEIIKNDRTILNGKELDIYIPELNIAIEYNGLYWHSDVYKDDKYHKLKTEECLSKGIILIHIFEDEWINKNKIVKSRLRNLLGKIDNKIYARKTIVKVIDNKTCKAFLETHHIQGNVNGSVYLGLFYTQNNIEYLVSVMSFGKLRKNLGNLNSPDGSYELLRFCNVNNHTVIGGAGKLLKYFETQYFPKFIVSYADRRWSTGNLYEKLNFQLSHISPPNYYYVNGLTREGRFNYRKDILVSKYNCLHEDTERNFMKQIMKMNRIYDCGALVYHKIF